MFSCRNIRKPVPVFPEMNYRSYSVISSLGLESTTFRLDGMDNTCKSGETSGSGRLRHKHDRSGAAVNAL